MSDREALGGFVIDGSSEAFAVLAERYARLVYGVARRRTGHHELAQEVAQNVFIVLARKAAALVRTKTPLAAWLHRAAVLESFQALRREASRHRVMKEFATHLELTAATETGAALDSLLPDLDEALDRLPRPDRELILARYFEERSYRDLAAATGRSEAALMQQHHRALQKLSRLFHRRGHHVSAAALAAGLGIPFASAAPAGLAATCAAGASASAATAISTSTLLQLGLAMHTKTQLALVIVVICLAAGTGVFFVVHREGADSAESVAAVSLPAGPGHDATSEAAASAGHPVSSATPPPVPSTAEVLAAEGRERLEKLALWLPGASPAEMSEMLERLGAMKESRTQHMEKELIYQRWVEVDRDGALAAVRKSESYTWLYYRVLGRLHPHEAWEEAQSLDSYEAGSVLRGIAEVDPRLARELLASSTKNKIRNNNNLHMWIADGLARIDPRQGWEYALEHGADSGVAVEESIRADPEAAIAFALGQSTAQKRAVALTSLLEQLRLRHPEKVESLLAALPEGRAKWQALARQAGWLAKTDPEAALAHARQVASPVARAVIQQELAAAWARSRPEEAVSLLKELDWSLSGNEYREPEITTARTPENHPGESKATDALFQLADQGRLDDALAVAEAVPPGPRREQALGAVAAGWPAERVYELSEWLVHQDAPSVREAGAHRIVEHLLAEAEPDFEAAARWASTLPVPDKVERAPLLEVMREWRKRDTAAAGTMLEELPVPEAVRAALEKPVSP